MTIYTEQKVYTPQDVYNEVLEVAAQDPHRVYIGEAQGCLYVHNRGTEQEEPGCIVGHALMRLGYTIPEDMEYTGAKYVTYALLNDLSLSYDHDRTQTIAQNPYLMALDVIQGAQDGGDQWIDAAEQGDKYLANRP